MIVRRLRRGTDRGPPEPRPHDRSATAARDRPWAARTRTTTALAVWSGCRQTTKRAGRPQATGPFVVFRLVLGGVHRRIAARAARTRPGQLLRPCVLGLSIAVGRRRRWQLGDRPEEADHPPTDAT